MPPFLARKINAPALLLGLFALLLALLLMLRQKGMDTQTVALITVIIVSVLAVSVSFLSSMNADSVAAEEIWDTFDSDRSSRLADKLFAASSDGRFVAERRVMTALFSDMEKFTTLAEELPPDALLRLINEYLSAMSKPIVSYGGSIDRYVGDAIMAFWGPPFTDETEHAVFACYAALEKIECLRDFRESLPRILGAQARLPDINIRIGISTGPMVLGDIGTDISRGYGVLGEAVHLGSQLECLNKQYGTRILISEATRTLAADKIEAREIDFVRIEGKEKVMRVFELLGKKGEPDEPRMRLRARFEEGLRFYRARDWACAREAFFDCLEIFPGDGPAKTFINRVATFAESPPPQDWNGVFCVPKH